MGKKDLERCAGGSLTANGNCQKCQCVQIGSNGERSYPTENCYRNPDGSIIRRYAPNNPTGATFSGIATDHKNGASYSPTGARCPGSDS
jgi:hypothetical protein